MLGLHQQRHVVKTSKSMLIKVFFLFEGIFVGGVLFSFVFMLQLKYNRCCYFGIKYRKYGHNRYDHLNRKDEHK